MNLLTAGRYTRRHISGCCACIVFFVFFQLLGMTFIVGIEAAHGEGEDGSVVILLVVVVERAPCRVQRSQFYLIRRTFYY